MPSSDTSLTGRLINAGIPAGNAVDVSAAISALPGSAVAAITSGTITGATVNNSSIGATTRSTVAATALALTATDSSGTPGNVTNNSARGKAAFAAAGSTVTVTNSLCTLASSVFCQLEFADATLTKIVSSVPGAGSFVVTGDVAATAATKFSFVVVN